MKCFEPDYLGNIRLCLLLRKRSQAKQHFGSLGERLGGEFVIGVSSEIADDDVVNRLTILTAVDFNTPVFTLEDLNGGQSFRLESVGIQCSDSSTYATKHCEIWPGACHLVSFIHWH